MEGLSLMEEGDDLTLNVESNKTEDSVMQWCLVGRFFTNKPFRAHIMKDQLSTIWMLVKGVTIKLLEQDRFLFQFYHKMDMERVLLGEPWLFDNYMLVLTKIQPGDPFLSMPLDHVDMWVKFATYPLVSCMRWWGKTWYIREFLDYDENNDSGLWHEYVRIRVRINVSKHLKKDRRVRKAGGDWLTVSFKYEKLGMFCFLCGLIGHSDQFCDQRFGGPEDLGER